MSVFQLKFDTGAIITLRETDTADGKNKYLAARPKDVPFVTRMGVNVAPAVIGGRLPKSVELLEDGKKVQAINLVSGATKTSGKPMVSGTFPDTIQVDGNPQTLKIERLSMAPKASAVNALIRSSRQAGGKVHTDL